MKLQIKIQKGIAKIFLGQQHWSSIEHSSKRLPSTTFCYSFRPPSSLICRLCFITEIIFKANNLIKIFKFFKQKCDTTSKECTCHTETADSQNRQTVQNHRQNQSGMDLGEVSSSTFCSKCMSTVFTPDFSGIFSICLEKSLKTEIPASLGKLLQHLIVLTGKFQNLEIRKKAMSYKVEIPLMLNTDLLHVHQKIMQPVSLLAFPQYQNTVLIQTCIFGYTLSQ